MTSTHNNPDILDRILKISLIFNNNFSSRYT